MPVVLNYDWCRSDNRTAQDVVTEVQTRLDKFEKQRVQEIKVRGPPNPFWGMLLSTANLKPVDANFKEAKNQLGKLIKTLK